MAELDRRARPPGHRRIGRDHDQIDRTAERGPQRGDVDGPRAPLGGVGLELDLDDHRGARDVLVPEHRHRIGPVLRRHDLRQVDRADLRARALGHDPAHAEQGARQVAALAAQVDEDLVRERGHGSGPEGTPRTTPPARASIENPAPHVRPPDSRQVQLPSSRPRHMSGPDCHTTARARWSTPVYGSLAMQKRQLTVSVRSHRPSLPGVDPHARTLERPRRRFNTKCVRPLASRHTL
jgi:hypothetical protein